MSAYLISRAALVTNVAEVALAITARPRARDRAGGVPLPRALRDPPRHLRASSPTCGSGSSRRSSRSRRPGWPTHRSGDLLARIVADIDTPRGLLRPRRRAADRRRGARRPRSRASRWARSIRARPRPAGVPRADRDRPAARAPAPVARRRRPTLAARRASLPRSRRRPGPGRRRPQRARPGRARHRLELLAAGPEVDRLGRAAGRRPWPGAGLAALAREPAGRRRPRRGRRARRDGRLDGVYLALLPLAAIASFEAVQPLALSLQLLGRATAAAAAGCSSSIDAPPAVADPAGPSPEPSGRHAIEIRDLRFRLRRRASAGPRRTRPDHPGRHEPRASSGRAGPGKSTLVNLLLRFWDSARARSGRRP